MTSDVVVLFAAFDPGMMMLLASVFSSIFGGLFGGGSDQELQSFANNSYNFDTDPRRLLSEGVGNVRDLYSRALPELSKPVSVPSAFVQQPPVMTGGGLPMPIGVVGQDPALFDPSLLTRSGILGGGDEDEALNAFNLMGLFGGRA